MSDLRDAAREYAALGWAVFPLHGIVNGRCTCGRRECSCPGKHPLVRRGLHEATTDIDQIEIWWRRWRSANIGIATGQGSGIVVIDIDLPRAFSSLDAVIHKLPRTLTGLTGGGGLHLIYRAHPEHRLRNRTSSLPGMPDLPGIDLRADGGYIVAPPSFHTSGERYQWLNLAPASEVQYVNEDHHRHDDKNDPHEPVVHHWSLSTGLVADAPTWLKEKERPVAPVVPPCAPRFTTGDGTPYGLAALEQELDRVRSAQVGTRNHTLNRVAFALAQLVAGGELSETAARSSLQMTALQIGLSDWESHRTINSAFTAGLGHPRFVQRHVNLSSIQDQPN